MTLFKNITRSTLFFFGLISFVALPVIAEEESYEDETVIEEVQQTTPASSKSLKPKSKKTEKRKFVTDHPERVDAGVFHVGFALGGNFYMEPEYTLLNATTGQKVFADNYYKDFGFQGGVYFDYDYSQLEENIPLGLRGMVGYKYILNSVNVFSLDFMIRRMFNFSEKVAFGLGFGGSAAIWFRKITDTTSNEETIFLPSILLGAGFEFNPFMVDFKWALNRIGDETTIMGFELYFGVRL